MKWHIEVPKQKIATTEVEDGIWWVRRHLHRRAATGHPDKEIGAMVELLMGGNGGILGTAEPLQQTTWGMECNS